MARMRSPNYPAFPVGEAIQRARELYNQEGTSHNPPEVVVTAWGYTGLNGASARVISAVRQYGLVEDVGREVRISERALAILLEPESSPDHQRAVLEASREPAIFAEILDEYPSGLPSEQGLIAYLVRKLGFTEDGAKKLNAVFRDTLAFASGAGVTNPPDAVAPTGRPGASEGVAGGLGQHQGAGHEGRAAPLSGGRVMTFEHVMLSGGTARISIASDDFTLEDVDDLYEWLQFLRRSMERRVQSEESPPVAASIAAKEDQ